MKLFQHLPAAKLIHFNRISNIMKPHLLFFLIFVPILLNAQIDESFSDGNFTGYPTWSGMNTNFIINTSGQLQSNATSTSVSYLCTPSQSFINAEWECWLKINYTTSSSNYAAVYIVSDNNTILNGCNAYYVQIGGTNDEVSLYVQQGTKKTKIIDGLDKRTDGNPIEIRIKVTRDAVGNFELFSKLPTESEYYSEGKVQNTLVLECHYFGLLFSNTSTTGTAYLFDDIIAKGEIAVDKEAPEWEGIHIEEPNQLKISFNERMNFSNGEYLVDNGIGTPRVVNVSADDKSATLIFDRSFEKGVIYSLQVSGINDIAGNSPSELTKWTGIPEAAMPGDLVLNEVMFENADNSVEYVEIYNNSEKVINLKSTTLTTRKTDGSLNSGHQIATETLMAPRSYAALCSDPDSLMNYHNISQKNIFKIGWSALNNQSSTLILCNEEKDTIYDELTYNAKWHHPLIKNTKGVALEKINPAMPTQDASSWHSAASEVKYGTPGLINSQYRDTEPDKSEEKMVWLDPEAFSPDNDGVNDLCFIRYKNETNGNVANVLILSAIGVKIRELASGILLSSEGYLTWDGRTDKGQIANAGIYILYFEVFNPESGFRTIKKLPLVVSFR